MSKTPNLLFSVDKWGWLLTKLENTVGEGIGPGHKYTVEQSEAQVQGLGVRVLDCKWTTAGMNRFQSIDGKEKAQSKEQGHLLSIHAHSYGEKEKSRCQQLQKPRDGYIRKKGAVL